MAVDLNSDVGESYGVWKIGDDAAMLRIVSSANVACGFHGGDPTTLRAACAAAAAHGVTIGAQVSYPDLVGFGRRFIDIDAAELRDAVLYQLGALDAFAQVAGREVDYVKPHGALYHATIDNVAAGRGRRRRRRRVRPVTGDPRPARLRVARRRRAGRTGGGVGGLRRSRLPTRRSARATIRSWRCHHRSRRGRRLKPCASPSTVRS